MATDTTVKCQACLDSGESCRWCDSSGSLTLDQAKRWAANVAMGDLIGSSEPPEGIRDQYPFNAVAFMKTLPDTWRDPVDNVIAFVYHNERKPEGYE